MTFLEAVANDLCNRNNSADISRYTVVFPNKRAAAFFNEYIYARLKRVVWPPKYLTIEELFASLSPYTQIDTIEAVCRLYNIYKQHVETQETLDQFWAWGEILLSDFNDIDKNLPFSYTAADVLHNLANLQELSSIEYLTDEQREALLTISSDSKLASSHVQKAFADVWNALYPIYEEFNNELFSLGLAYEGALQRHAVQHLTDDSFGKQTYVFVGFSILSDVEHALFRELQKQDKALFYWDYDVYYVHKETTLEAGVNMRKNLQDFPNQLPESFFNSFADEKDWEMIQAHTESSQAYYVNAWLNKNLTADDQRRTAVVLCNEDLIDSVVHALPSTKLADVNLTKGYPVARTAAYSLVENQLRALAVKGVAPAEVLEELLQLIFTETQQAALSQKEDDTDEQPDTLPAYDRFVGLLYTEALFKIYTSLNRLQALVQKGILTVNTATLCHLIRQLLSAQTIPFEGNPLIGVQVMGMLETRNLDFDHILILSANETYLPQSKNADSYIPYLLRRAYGLTLPENKTEASSYHFYRLIQRAKKVTFVYNTTESAGMPSDRSRYLLQLLLNAPHPIAQYALRNSADIDTSGITESYCKPVNMVDLIFKSCDSDKAFLSPTAINKYLECPMKFYYASVAHLKKETLLEDDIDGRMYGNLFHSAAEIFYKALLCNQSPKEARENETTWIDKPVDMDRLKALRQREDYLNEVLSEAFVKEHYNEDLLVKEILKKQLCILLDEDLKLQQFRIIALEHKMYGQYNVRFGEKDYTLQIGGIIDRLDSYVTAEGERVVRVLDYKTGKKAEAPKKLDKVIPLEDHKEHNKYFFQTLLYAHTVKHAIGENVKMSAQLFHPYKKNHYFISFDDESAIVSDETLEQYHELLCELLNKHIFNIEKPFLRNQDDNQCGYCDFRLLCRREKQNL